MVWENLKKKKEIQTETQKKKNETAFTAKFQNLIHEAHGDAIEMINVQEDSEFLLCQWNQKVEYVWQILTNIFNIKKKMRKRSSKIQRIRKKR